MALLTGASGLHISMAACTANPMTLSPPYIVCAANRRPDGLIIAGARHWDSVMRATVRALDTSPDYGAYDQGFIDQHGKWYTRTEAWAIAQANGQIKRRVGGDTADGGTLYSEALYP